MYYFHSKDILNLIKAIDQAIDLAYNTKDTITQNYPNWDVSNDIRITTFAKIINVLNSTKLSFVFINQNLLDSDWWSSTLRKNISDESKKIYTSEYMNFAKLGLTQFIFSSIESSMRILLKTIDQYACKNSTAEFSSIYNSLLKNKLSSNFSSSLVLLDMFRLIRNTILNNGVYFHRDNKDEKVTFKGKEYNFIIGKAVDFVTWEFLIDLVIDLINLNKDIVNDKNISSIFTNILDPFSLK